MVLKQKYSFDLNESDSKVLREYCKKENVSMHSFIVSTVLEKLKQKNAYGFRI